LSGHETARRAGRRRRASREERALKPRSADAIARPRRDPFRRRGSRSWRCWRASIASRTGSCRMRGIGRGRSPSRFSASTARSSSCCSSPAPGSARCSWPLNWRLAHPEHAAILVDAEPRLLLHDESFAGPAHRLAGAGCPALCLEGAGAEDLPGADGRRKRARGRSGGCPAWRPRSSSTPRARPVAPRVPYSRRTRCCGTQSIRR